MRGGEGLAAAAAYAVTADGTVINPISGIYQVNGGKLYVTSGYPHTDKASFRYEGGGRIYLYAPPWLRKVKCEAVAGCDEHYVYLDLPDGKDVEITFDSELWCDETPGGKRVYDGPLMLGADYDAKIDPDGVVKRDNGYFYGDTELFTLECAYLHAPRKMKVIF
jgi:hypothetical protein